MALLSRKEKRLSMLWRVEKGGRLSYMVGTVHFFPFSFRDSLRRLIGSVDTVLLEGPLDAGSMEDVVKRGSGGDAGLLLQALDAKTIRKINRELGYFSDRSRSVGVQIGLLGGDAWDPFSSQIRGLTPWMAFFQSWFQFLGQRGWRYSMDLDAYEIARDAGKEVVFLETIEEQIQALEGIPLERIVAFLKEVDKWSGYAREHVRFYLRGDLDGWPGATMGFPTRCEAILDRRDPVLFERMKVYMERGRAVAFVGVPHVRGIRPLFLQAGFELVQERI